MEHLKVSKYGSIIPTTISDINKVRPIKNKRIAFRSNNNGIFVGILLGDYEENSIHKVLGIKIEQPFPFCIDKENKFFDHEDCEYNYMIYLKSTNYIEIDEFGFIKQRIENSKEFKYKKDDIVLLKMNDIVKAATIQKSGEINGIACHEIILPKSGDCATILDKNIVGKLLDDDNLVSDLNDLTLQIDESIVNVEIGQPFNYLNYNGILKWKGTVNDLECVGIEGDYDKMSDFSFFTKTNASYWVMIPFDRNRYIGQEKRQDAGINSQIGNSSAPIDKNQSIDKVSHQSHIRKLKETNLIQPLSKMECENSVLKINKDCYYIYAIVNSMFMFTELFDSLIFEVNDDICKYLSSEIVIPIRNHSNGDDNWSEMLKKMPNKSGDLFHSLLMHIKFNIKMFNIEKNVEENVDMINFTSLEMIKPKVKINEMLNFYCLKKNHWIKKPPKCMIFGFIEDKHKVQLLYKLDISKLTVTCFNCCSVCSTEADGLCLRCSNDKNDITYFCKDHKTHCKHTKKDIIEWSKSLNKSKGKVELELSSVICKEGQNYHAYVKTNDVKGNWVRFSLLDNGVPTATEIDLESYFSSNIIDSRDQSYKKDIENLENHVFRCIYKYPPLEFYWNGF